GTLAKSDDAVMKFSRPLTGLACRNEGATLPSACPVETQTLQGVASPGWHVFTLCLPSATHTAIWLTGGADRARLAMVRTERWHEFFWRKTTRICGAFW